MTYGALNRVFPPTDGQVTKDEVLFEVRTHQLLEESAKKYTQLITKHGIAHANTDDGDHWVGRDGIDTHILEVEAHDEGHDPQFVVEPGENVLVDTIVGYMFEDALDDNAQRREVVETTIRDHNASLGTVSDEGPVELRREGLFLQPMLWQAYVKSGGL